MSHFYATARGHRGQATRTGSKNSGIETYAASWSGAVRVTLWWNCEDEKDWATVYLVPWNGKGILKLLYNGPVDRSPLPELEKLVGIEDNE